MWDSACEEKTVMRSRGSASPVVGAGSQRLHAFLIGVGSLVLVLTSLTALSSGGEGGQLGVTEHVRDDKAGDGGGGQEQGVDGDGGMDFMSSPEFLRMSQTDRIMVRAGGKGCALSGREENIRDAKFEHPASRVPVLAFFFFPTGVLLSDHGPTPQPGLNLLGPRSVTPPTPESSAPW